MTTGERAKLARGVELLDDCRSIVVEICRDPNAAAKLAKDYEQIQDDLRDLLSELDEDTEDVLPWRDVWHLLEITTGTEDEALAKFNAVVGDHQALFNGIQRAGPQWELEFYEEAGRHPVVEWAKKLPKSRRASLFVALERILAYKERTCLRVFFAVDNGRLLLLLAGYDKGADDGRRRQAQEIEIARRRLAMHHERR